MKKKKKKKKAKKKRRAKFFKVRKEPGATAGDYDYKESMASINRIINEYRVEFEDEFAQSTRKMIEDIKKTATQKIQEILDIEFENKNLLIKKLNKTIKKVIKKSVLRQAINDAFQQVNRGEELAMANVNLKCIKAWMTQFDDRVREWHVEMHNKKVPQDKLFKVDYPGGTDFLKGPKIPPISVANFINCRCFLEFWIQKGRRSVKQ